MATVTKLNGYTRDFMSEDEISEFSFEGRVHATHYLLGEDVIDETSFGLDPLDILTIQEELTSQDEYNTNHQPCICEPEIIFVNGVPLDQFLIYNDVNDDAPCLAAGVVLDNFIEMLDEKVGHGNYMVNATEHIPETPISCQKQIVPNIILRDGYSKKHERHCRPVKKYSVKKAVHKDKRGETLRTLAYAD